MPTGTVTFLFTDVEKSTRLWQDHPSEMQAALGRHDKIVRSSIENNGGYVFSLAGDQFVAAFHQVSDAIAAATDAQAQVGAEDWPEHTPIRVRIGIHIGVADERDHDYFGPVLNRTARIVSAAHGGQTLLSGAVAAMTPAHDLVDLGEHRLKDLAEAEHLWQIGHSQHPQLRTMQALRHNLPIERTALVGRTSDINDISKRVLDNRLVTLLGIGGTGKSRLALAIAAEVADRFPDGAWFIDLVPATDLNSVVEAVADALGLLLTGTDLLGTLADQLEARNALIVFDNCEHLTDDVADVIDHLLERTAQVHVIATSRELLDLPDEYQVRVSPLVVEPTAASPAVQLFSSTAQRVGVTIGDDDLSIVADICQQLDGLPLSIELAAGQLRQLSLPEISERLDHRFELLERTRRSRSRRRQHSLRDVLAESWSMLDETEQHLLKALAAFPSTFTLPDVEGLIGARSRAAHTLGGLSDRGLIAGDGRSGSRLLETVKLFVRDQWTDDAETAHNHLDAHTDWVLGHLREHGAADHHQSVALAGWAISHYDDHRSVEDRLAAAGRYDELAELVRSLRWAYSRETAQRAAGLIDRIERYLTQADLTNHQAGSLNLAAGRAARAARDPHWIHNGGKQAVELFRPDGDSAELAAALIAATYDAVVRNPPEAFALLDEAHRIAEDIGAVRMVAATLAYRANYLMMARRSDEVQEVLDQLAPLLDRARPDNTLVMTLEATLMANLVSNPPLARAAIEECVELMSQHGVDRDWFMLLYLAIGTATTGDVTTTRRHLAEIDILLSNSGIDGLPDLLLPYVALAHATGDGEQSKRWLAAIRHAPGNLGTGISIAAYRLHRTACGVADSNPLDTSTPDDVREECRQWAAGLT